MRWIIKPFEALTVLELYALLRLRSAVFVVEQTCPFLDMDGKDLPSRHVLGYTDEELVACSRIVPPGVSYPEVSIGRVATHPDYRGTGLGREVMRRSIALIAEERGAVPVRIGAQLYLKSFYQSFGFVQEGEVYDEDGIPHIIMLRPGAAIH